VSKPVIAGECIDSVLATKFAVRILVNDGGEVKRFTAKVAKRGRGVRQASPHS